MNPRSTLIRRFALAISFPALMCIAAIPAPAQSTATPGTPIGLSLDEAIQIALVRNYAVRNARLDVDEARSLVREGWGQVLPQVSWNSSYNRNIRTANPFAGSDAGGFFQSFGFIDWLAFNERARTDNNDATSPITVEEFFARQAAGLDAAGVQPTDSDNPFAVPNQFRSGVSVTQKIFDIRTFWGVAGAQKYLGAAREAGVEMQEQQLIDDVRRQYYQALLAEANKRVVAQSVSRTRATASEAAQRVARGVAPKFQRLSAEVELANLETQLISASGDSDAALDQLKFTLGIPVTQPLVLTSPLQPDGDATMFTVGIDDALQVALRNRPDIRQTELNLELEDIQWKVARAEYFPTLDANANFAYTGNVPDSRSITLSDPTDPFSFSTARNGFFSDDYWDFTASVGLTLNWTLFDGFQRRQRVQQRAIATERAEIAQEQLVNAVRLEVEQAMRDVRTARLRIDSQEKNVDRAELNYEYASARLREGVASPLEEREASELLDQSRLGFLQAVFDYNTALSRLEKVTGTIRLADGPDSNLTMR